MKNSISARSPLSPTLWPKDAFRWWASLGVALAVAVASFVPAIVAVLGFAAARPGSVRIDPAHPVLTWPLLAVQLVSNVGSVAAVVVFLPALAKRSLSELGLRAPRLRDVAWGVAGGVAMWLTMTLVAALQQAIFHLKADEVQVQFLRNVSGASLAGIVFVACVAAPITEELFFRGFVFNAIRRYAPTATAAVLSGIVFGLAHWQHGSEGAIAPLAAGGMALAVVYYRSGSLVASMLAHALLNTVTVILVAVFHQSN